MGEEPEVEKEVEKHIATGVMEWIHYQYFSTLYGERNQPIGQVTTTPRYPALYKAFDLQNLVGEGETPRKIGEGSKEDMMKLVERLARPK